MKNTIIIYNIGNIRFCTALPAIHSAIFLGILRIAGMGQIINIPQILNNRCEKATANGAIVPDTKLAKMAVTVVPIFAPNEYGNICFKDKIPAPAIGTTKLVVIELL